MNFNKHSIIDHDSKWITIELDLRKVIVRGIYTYTHIGVYFLLLYPVYIDILGTVCVWVYGMDGEKKLYIFCRAC